LWRNGEESGHVQEIKSIFYDCDADALLVQVNQVGGAACHEGYQSCFFRKLSSDGSAFEVVGHRVFDPAVVYKQGTQKK
jgi:phosphoribosyl-AMP cyclohydrolase